MAGRQRPRLGHRRVRDAPRVDRRPQAARRHQAGAPTGARSRSSASSAARCAASSTSRALGENTIYLDCDVLTADGGTRCASITGAYVALALACDALRERGVLERSPLTGSVAAVSAGIVDGAPLLDLDYARGLERRGRRQRRHDRRRRPHRGPGHRRAHAAVAGEPRRAARARRQGRRRAAGRAGARGRPRGAREAGPRHPQRAQGARAGRAARRLRRRRRCPTTSRCRPRRARRSPTTRCPRRARRPRPPARRPSATTRGSSPPRSAARPACARRASPARTRPTPRTWRLLLERAPPGSALAYVCVIALVDPHTGEERSSRAAARGRWPPRRAARAASATTRSSSPTTATTAARWPSSRRPRRTPSAIAAAPRARCASHLREAAPAQPMSSEPSKTGAAALSVASNSALILLKAIAGTITGSVALLTEALHSATDLVASIVALFSVRAADVPADESHPYGHEKIEDMAAAIEGVLILVGSRRHRLRGRAPPDRGHGRPAPRRRHRGARRVDRRQLRGLAEALAARRGDRLGGAGRRRGPPDHRHAELGRRARRRWSLVAVTGWDWLDPVVALVVAAVVAVTGVRILTRSSRVLVDETLPDPELEPSATWSRPFAERGDRRLPRAARPPGRRAAPRRPARAVPLGHLARGGPPHRPHAPGRHPRAPGPADVLIHLEPEDRVRPGRGDHHGRATARAPPRAG